MSNTSDRNDADLVAVRHGCTFTGWSIKRWGMRWNFKLPMLDARFWKSREVLIIKEHNHAFWSKKKYGIYMSSSFEWSIRFFPKKVSLEPTSLGKVSRSLQLMAKTGWNAAVKPFLPLSSKCCRWVVFAKQSPSSSLWVLHESILSYQCLCRNQTIIS